MDWTVDPDSERPPSRQIVEAVLDGLARGELKSGDRLPSVRGLASQAMINHNTVARAWRDLEQMGVARGQNGRGVFLTPNGPRIARAARQETTRVAFERALEEALRAGHDPGELEELVREACEQVRNRKSA